MQRAAADTNAAVRELHGAYGDAFVFGFGPIRSHWLIGAEANRLILAERPDAFRQRGAYLFLEPIGGPDALIASDEPEHLLRRRTVQPAFHRDQVGRWTQLIAERFESLFAEAARTGGVDVHAGARALVLELVIDLLLGTREPNERDRWRDDLAAMMDFANRPLLEQLVKLPLPGLPWSRFVAARRRSDRRLYAEIARRRRSGQGGDDILALLLAGGEPSGRSIRDQAISLVSAAFDTTSSALCWTVYLLAEHPQVAGALREELDACPPEARLASTLLDDVVKEALRLYPPASAGLRRVAEPLEAFGYLLPRGALAAFSIYLTQRDPDTFAEPDRFQPHRWRTISVSPFSYLPFGYGRRYCIGAPLAQTVIKVAVATLLAAYRFEPAYAAPVIAHGTTLQPLGGLPIRVRRR